MAGLYLVDQAYGHPAKARFDAKVIEEGWAPYNDLTMAYYRQNNAMIERNMSLRKDLADPEFQ